jgi:hypothetical protein
VAFPPFRPAATFCAWLPPLPGPLLLRLWLEPLLLPPRLEDPSELEIAAARDLLMPFSRRPSYCLSFLMLGPWSLVIVAPFGVFCTDTRQRVVDSGQWTRV